MLTALVPGSLIILSAATLIANDMVRPLSPNISEDAVTLIARAVVPLLALVAVFFTLQRSQTIVALLRMGYSFVTQLFPALICSLMARNPMTRQGAAAGIIAGAAVVVYVTLTPHGTFVSVSVPPRQGRRHQHRLRGVDRQRGRLGRRQFRDAAGGGSGRLAFGLSCSRATSGPGFSSTRCGGDLGSDHRLGVQP